MKLPVWQIEPKELRSKNFDPALKAAYRARTLHLVVTQIAPGYEGYAYAADAESAEEGAAWLRSQPATIKNGRAVTVRPYPFADEVSC